MTNYIWGWPGRRRTAGCEPPHPRESFAAPAVNPTGNEPNVEQIVDMPHLIRVYDRLRREAGQAPGADGVSYDQMGRKEAADVLRPKREAILRGRWRPDPTRRVRIPKLTGGVRVLSLPSVADRVLFASLNEWMSPLWERHFLERSHGFRPRHSRMTLLAALDTEVTTTGRTVLVLDDIRNAFNQVCIADCLNAHRQYLRGERLLTFITHALRGHPWRTIGIDQGNAYSPTALNVLLHVFLDLRLDPSGGDQFRWWYRYADNLVYPCTNVSEGRHVRRLITGLLRETGMTLKGSDDMITDIRETSAEILGVTTRMVDDRPTYAIPDAAWEALDLALMECHESAHPPETARTVIMGWIEAYGSTLANQTDATLLRIYRTAIRNGFRELSNQSTLARYARNAFRRWERLRVVRQQTRTEETERVRPPPRMGPDGQGVIPTP